MDDRRFDNLSRALARGVPRRTLLKGLTGGTLAGAVALVGQHQGAAIICRQPGVLCAKDVQCCSASCDGETHRCACPIGEVLCGRTCAGCCDDTDCDSSETCQQGQCLPRCTPVTCAAKGIDCGPLNDGCGTTLACGDCPCGSCQGGRCACPDGTTVCGGNCVTNCAGGNVLDQDSCTCVCPNDVPYDCGGGQCAVCCTDDQCSEGDICATSQECFDGTSCPEGEFCHYGAGCQPTQCCRPQEHLFLCAGWCGSVIDNCGQRVDCGDCPICRSCHVDGSHNSCFDDASQNGNACDLNDANRICCHGECAKATGAPCDRDFDCCSGSCRGGVCCATSCGAECCNSGTCCSGLGPSPNSICCASNCCSISTTTGDATCC